MEGKNFFKEYIDKIKEVEWGISVSVGGYLVLITIGMLFSFCYYFTFKINIFKFSELSDFILIPFSDPFTIIFTIVSLGVIYALSLFSEWHKTNYPESFRKWTYWFSFGTIKETESEVYKKKEKGMYIFSVIIYVFYAAMFYGIRKHNKVIENRTFLDYKVDFETQLPAPVKDSLVFLGDNAGYYFLYHISKKEAYIVPKDKLNYVRIKKNPNGRFY